eukprot:TRINITY_DN69291_c0_g1_i1.p1 TRINITY_DN69291_c0_g1~~TRINITY_DN69291_c0_g1_i1.p1  ORF type:complete len:447 (+),score=42.68 TRINITY_DN69291_c0_g1_i1:90-1343(+)
MAPALHEERNSPSARPGLVGAYEKLWKSAFRPPRNVPQQCDHMAKCYWGVRRKSAEPVVYERSEFTLLSDRAHALKCSYFSPMEDSLAESSARPCVVYLHGMSGCRTDVVTLLPHLLKYDITVCSVDFSGCGESGGTYVSLGHHEQHDLRVVLDHLRSLSSVASVALWGWSMGAVVAILRSAEDRGIAACVLDSPFTDVSTVFREVAGHMMPAVPNMLVSLGIAMLRHEGKTRAGFDLTELRPIDQAPQISCPALFGVADRDEITRPHHTQEIFEAWGGKKRIAVFEGDHTSSRPDSFLQEATAFLWKELQIGAAANGFSLSEKPAADSVFLVEPGGALHLSMREGAGPQAGTLKCKRLTMPSAQLCLHDAEGTSAAEPMASELSGATHEFALPPCMISGNRHVCCWPDEIQMRLLQ